MDSLQLFSGLLFVVCGLHLVFSVQATISRWVEKNRNRYPILVKVKGTPIYFDWYVFFDPADLHGKQPRSAGAAQRRKQNETVSKQSPARRPRVTARM
jgi:hypothetical protein